MNAVQKRGTLIILTTLLVISALAFASAEIIISQPQSLYNLGDKFDLTITISEQQYSSNFLTASLVCSGKETELLKGAYTVEPGVSRQVQISTSLDNFLVAGLEGTCHVRADYGSEEALSQEFTLTKGITVNPTIQGVVFDPQNTVPIRGEAQKSNGDLLDGFIEVTIPEADFSFVGEVAAGKFNTSFMIPADMPAGSYKINFRAYEKDFQGTITNEGSAESTITVRQVVKKIDIATSAQSVVPTDDITYSVLLYDQADDQAVGDVSVTVTAPDQTVERVILKSGDTQTIDLEPNSPSGYWRIEAKYNDLITYKDVFVQEYRDVSFTLVNETLVIQNIGNVPYIGPVAVTIGDISEVKDIQLDVGESKRFRLAAPNGEYAIEVGKGSEKQQLGIVPLTGKAISVNAVGEGSFSNGLVVLGGVILLLILAVIAVFIYRKISKRSALSGGAPLSTIKPSTPPSGGAKPLLPATAAAKEGPNMIDKGEKQESAIVSLKIKNMPALESNPESMQAIDSALWKAKEAGAKIYSDDNYRIMIFAPVLTREKDNSVRAVRVAQAIEKSLSAVNRRTALKIDYGIGVDFGNLIVENEGGKFKFMSINNIIATTKRISEQSGGETLISESLKRRTTGKIKSEKLHDKNLWKVTHVVDRSAHADYVHHMTKKG